MTTLDTNLTLPPRLTESAFRKFELDIFTILKNYPELTTLSPKAHSLAPITYACRLRDAMTSFYDHAWTSQIDHERFKDLYLKIKVSEAKTGSGLVYAGPLNKIRALHAGAGTFVSASCDIISIDHKLHPSFSSDSIIELNGLKPEQVLFLAELSGQRLLSKPIKLKLSPELETMVSTQYDVLLEKQQDGSFLLI